MNIAKNIMHTVQQELQEVSHVIVIVMEERVRLCLLLSLTRKDTWVLDCRVNNGNAQSDCKQLEEVYENAKKKTTTCKKEGWQEFWIMTDIV